MATTCEVDPSIGETLKKFTLAKAKESSAIILKINNKQLKVEIDEQFDDDLDIQDLADALPTSAPRYVLLSYKWQRDDGYGERVQYPLLFIYYIPHDINPTFSMLYSSTKTQVQNLISCTKSLELRDAEELDDEWLLKQLENVKR